MSFQMDTDAVGISGSQISEGGLTFAELVRELKTNVEGILLVWKGEDANEFEKSHSRLDALLSKAAANMEIAGNDLSATSRDTVDVVAENKNTIGKTMNNIEM